MFVVKGNAIPRHFVAFLVMVSCVLAPCWSVADTWVPVQDVSLEIEAGSILDFSSMVGQTEPIQKGVRVNSQGQWVVEGQEHLRKRFLIGSLGFGVNLGGFPNHALIDLYVKQYKAHGYNMVRLDFVESLLMEGRQSDFDFNPEQLDRFHYLVYALKQQGIYLLLNGLSNGNGGYGNIAQRWISQKKMHAGVYVDPEKQAHWKQLIATMYGRTNPYTGISVLKDPVLAAMIMVNEGNLVFLNRNGVSPALKPHFANWLQRKYGNRLGLKQAWSDELKDAEDLSNATVAFPSPDAWTSKRMADTQAFFFDTERDAARWMEQYLRTLGFRGAVTAYNLWHAPAAHASRGQLPWVDMHHYFAHPEYLDNASMKVNQQSMLNQGAVFIRELAVSRHIAKPFTVSEHGQVFWNHYRRENALAISAYAALQDWDGICQHSGAVDVSYAPTVGRKPIIHPFAVGTDPIARVTETLAALLFLRGDVAKANHFVGVYFDAEDAFVKSAHLGSVPSDVAKLSLLLGVGLDWEGKATSQPATMPDAVVRMHAPGMRRLNSEDAPSHVGTSLGSQLDGWIKRYAEKIAYKASKAAFLANSLWEERVANIRSFGWLSPTNQTDAKAGVYHSDTDEILLESEKKQLRVITDKTEAIVFDQPSKLTLNNLTVLSAQKGALLALSSMDGQPIHTSRRMLLILATDARNSEMRFRDSSHEILTHLGKPPVLILANKVDLALRNSHASQLKVFSTNLRGQRKDAIKLKQTSTSIEFTLDISKLTHGATTFFEISV